jgi:hypothetical protein
LPLLIGVVLTGIVLPTTCLQCFNLKVEEFSKEQIEVVTKQGLTLHRKTNIHHHYEVSDTSKMAKYRIRHRYAFDTF